MNNPSRQASTERYVRVRSRLSPYTFKRSSLASRNHLIGFMSTSKQRLKRDTGSPVRSRTKRIPRKGNRGLSNRHERTTTSYCSCQGHLQKLPGGHTQHIGRGDHKRDGIANYRVRAPRPTDRALLPAPPLHSRKALRSIFHRRIVVPLVSTGVKIDNLDIKRK